MTRILPLAAVAFATITMSSLAAETGSGSLTVQLTGLKSTDGEVRVALFKSEADYSGDKMANGTVLPASPAGVKAVFSDLKPGDYALKTFHDVNGNGKLDANLLGVPTEPHAFSNNAAGQFGPASWADAHFAVQAGDNTHTITLE